MVPVLPGASEPPKSHTCRTAGAMRSSSNSRQGRTRGPGRTRRDSAERALIFFHIPRNIVSPLTEVNPHADAQVQDSAHRAAPVGTAQGRIAATPLPARPNQQDQRAVVEALIQKHFCLRSLFEK